MTDYGKIIATLRKEHNMTQSELGDALNVTFQAVSKWERNLSQPDLDTIKAIANLFKVSLDVFNDDANTTTQPTVDSNQVASTATDTATAVKPVEKFVCSNCNKVCTRSEMATFVGKPLCHSCYQKQREEKENKRLVEKNLARYSAEQIRKSFYRALIVLGAVFVGFTVLSLILNATSQTPLSFGNIMISATFISAFVMQMCYDSAIRGMICWGFTRVVRMPGVIFSLSLDGLIFLLLFKIIAPIVGALIGLSIGIVTAFVAFFISPLFAPFSLIALFHKSIRAFEEYKEMYGE